MTEFERQLYEIIDALAPHGYSLSFMKEFNRRHGKEPSLGAVYVICDRLEEQGWIRSQMEPGGPERNYRLKRIYYIARRLEPAAEPSAAPEAE